jgi:hypothetical protein
MTNGNKENIMAEKQAKGQPKEMLKVKDLIATHELYDQNVTEWQFLQAVFEGIREIIRLELVEKHEREPQESYTRRLNELYGFGYTKSIVEIFQFHLLKKPATERVLGKLQDDELWKMFSKDADLFGNDYDAVISEISLYAAIQGHMGVLIDKAMGEFKTKAEQIDKKVYPYIAKYFPAAILDWVWERDEYNRPFLAYLKLLDDDEQYRIWTPENWEIWELPEDEDGEKTDSKRGSGCSIHCRWFKSHKKGTVYLAL